MAMDLSVNTWFFADEYLKVKEKAFGKQMRCVAVVEMPIFRV